MIKNKYKSKCKSCNKPLVEGEGFAFKDTTTNKWGAVCTSSACHKNLGLTESQEKRITEDGLILMPFDYSALPLIKSLTGSRWRSELPNKPWQVSVEVKDLPRVIELAERLGLTYPDSFKQKVEEGTADSREALKRAERKRSDGKGLYGFQKEGVKFLSLNNYALLADEQGLGKTVETLLAIGENERVIIVCPASLKYNWQNEIKMWRPEYKTTVCEGRSGFKLPEPGEIVIINYDILPNELNLPDDKDITFKENIKQNVPVELVEGLKECRVVADEFQMVKNYKSIRSKRFKVLSHLSRGVWGLTGTPLDNRPLDLYGVMQAGNMNVFGSLAKFVEMFNGYKNAYDGYEFGMPTPEVHERLKRVMLRRLRKDVLPDLPTKTFKNIVVDIDSKISKALDKLAVEAVIGQGLADEKMIKKLDVNCLIDSLDAEDLPNFKDFSKLRALLAESRIPAMLEIIESYEESGTPLVVFSAHRKPIDTLEKRDGWGVINGDTPDKKRFEIVELFQSGKLKGVALTIAAGGTGHTLTAASNMLFVDEAWKPSQNLQAQDRIVRISATVDKVLIIRLSSNHPLDKHIQDLLDYKMMIAYEALDKENKTEVKDNGPVLIEETEEEMLARKKDYDDVIGRAEKEADRSWSLKRLEGIVERERNKSSHVIEPVIDSRRKELLRDALEYMVSRCDGAHEKDYMGFNKPDASIGHWISRTGLRDEDEVAFRVLERMLVRYPKQLKGMFEEIWK
jgi:SWI/SNF-related matrix-associated actin-dependent regulator 1 of chromatin subfamily A